MDANNNASERFECYYEYVIYCCDHLALSITTTIFRPHQSIEMAVSSYYSLKFLALQFVLSIKFKCCCLRNQYENIENYRSYEQKQGLDIMIVSVTVHDIREYSTIIIIIALNDGV